MTTQFCMFFWHISYCKVQQNNFITKCDRLLLQSASGITKCDSYYKVRRNTFTDGWQINISIWPIRNRSCNILCPWGYDVYCWSSIFLSTKKLDPLIYINGLFVFMFLFSFVVCNLQKSFHKLQYIRCYVIISGWLFSGEWWNNKIQKGENSKILCYD